MVENDFFSKWFIKDSGGSLRGNKDTLHFIIFVVYGASVII